MTTHVTVSRDKWLEARLDLLAAEKDLTRRSDQIAQLRRQLPWVKIDKLYVFDGAGGQVALAGLFEGRHQLLVQHFMLAPGWEQGCPSCSYMADHADGMTVHLAHRDVTFVAVPLCHSSCRLDPSVILGALRNDSGSIQQRIQRAGGGATATT